MERDPTEDMTMQRFASEATAPREEQVFSNFAKFIFSINKSRVHWLLIQVHLADKTIKVWDSMDHKVLNIFYLQTMCCYLYNDQHQGGQSDRPGFEDWIQDRT